MKNGTSRKVLRGIALLGVLFLVTIGFFAGAVHAESTAVSNVPVKKQLYPAGIVVRPLDPPIPVNADGKVSLFYELSLVNMGGKPLYINEVTVSGESGRRIVSFGKDQLRTMVIPYFSVTDTKELLGILRGTVSVVFLRLEFPKGELIPGKLNHSITFTSAPGLGEVEAVVDAPVVEVSKESPVVIASPVFGDGWLAAEGSVNINGFSHHRFGVITQGGTAHIPQRYAIDWVKFGKDGLLVKGDPRKNENWYCYGEKIHAVADGVVVSAIDGIPENVPLETERAVPITIETVAGNLVVTDIGEGRYALYAHMIPGSVKVKKGDRVKRGQVLGLLGNSGNSDAPHLHFHISSTPGITILAADGLPFVHKTLLKTGEIPIPFPMNDSDDFSTIKWNRVPPTPYEEMEYEMPTGYRIYTFPR